MEDDLKEIARMWDFLFDNMDNPMSRKEFSEHTGIPVRTLEDWEAGKDV